MTKTMNNMVPSNNKDTKLSNIDRFEMIEDGLRKKYLSRLSELEVAPISITAKKLPDLVNDMIDNIRLYHVTEMVYQKGEQATNKFTTVFNTLSTYHDSVFVIIDSNGEKADFYVGVRNNDMDDSKKRSAVTLGDTLKNTLIGNFPGIKLKVEDRKKIEEISQHIQNKTNISSVSVKGSFKDEKDSRGNDFAQGLESLILAMQGRKYMGIVIAESEDPNTVGILRQRYEDIYSKLSPYQKVQYSDSVSSSTARDKSFSEMNSKQKAAMLGGAFVGGIGAVGGFALGGGIEGSIIGGQIAGQLNSFINSLAPKEQITQGTTTGTNTTYEDKKVTDLLKLLDEAINRTNEFDSYGMWNVAAYFASDDMSDAEIAASNYRSLMNGETSGRELSAINSWREQDIQDYNQNNFEELKKYLSRFIHPQFYYSKSKDNEYGVLTDATTTISGKELGIHIGIPRATTSGLPVIEHAEFGKEVSSYSSTRPKSLKPEDRMTLGKIFDLGQVTNRIVELDNRSLNMHTFITGSTGSGKSNTVYQMLTELYQDQIPFLVVEPAKGEYKDVFGNWSDVNVFSTNPNVAQLININPFMFPDSIHVLEHIDGLVEIFSVCWPMYDAMPAFFKDAILKSYEAVGWDLGSSTFEGETPEYPDFEILSEQLDVLISQSDYASDIKSNYRGALITRVKSLAIGLNKFIFTREQTPYAVLFDQNCILDISRVKSNETKALLMGLIVYILNEYRVDQKTENNSGLKHITVLEEAHNLLKNSKGESEELVGKSVEMITQTIAEIRTFGEGFIIVDQSPSSVDIAAIKNTNTKIVLRTPEANDREAAGRSMGLTPDQVNEIAKLPNGVAVVYQNDWANPVLTKINKANISEQAYVNEAPVTIKSIRQARTEIVQAIMEPWMQGDEIEFNELASALKSLDVARPNRELLCMMICTYRDHGGHLLWNERSIKLLQELLFDILNISKQRYEDIVNADNPNLLRQVVATNTKGLSPEQIEEVCHVLTMEA